LGLPIRDERPPASTTPADFTTLIVDITLGSQRVKRVWRE
jgi:hypothetical protein